MRAKGYHDKIITRSSRNYNYERRWSHGVEIHKEPPQIVLITDHRDYGDPMVYRIDIADSVFDELQEKGFIRGFPMWGYTSESRFYATETCREYRRAEREKLSFL